MANGLISKGTVDERSVTEIRATDLVGETRAHFFAGIAGWELALQLAGWPNDRPVWSASLPCQPWSCAGKGLGESDERHLWPVFFELIKACRPELIFGEQVERAIKLGWLDGVQADLEAEGYTFGHVVLGAHSVGAPHKRQRIFWGASRVGNSSGNDERRNPVSGTHRKGQPTGRSSGNGGMGVSESEQRYGGGTERRGRSKFADDGGLAHPCITGSQGVRPNTDGQAQRNTAGRASDADDRLANTELGKLQRRREPGELGASQTKEPGEGLQRERAGNTACDCCADGGLGDPNGAGSQQRNEPASSTRYWSAVESTSFWSNSTTILCRDGKYRRIPAQSGLFDVVARLPTRMDDSRTHSALSAFPLAPKEAFQNSRVGLLRGYGNAICPSLGAMFIKAFIESIGEL